MGQSVANVDTELQQVLEMSKQTAALETYK